MAITKKLIPISALKDNYIWLFFDENSNNAWVVDPGDAKPVLTFLNKHALNLEGILITHHHYDHTGGVENLRQHFPDIKIYGSHLSPHPFITHRLQDNQAITCSNHNFKILEIPGHTLDHIAYYDSEILFSGDTLFSMGCGKIFEGNPSQMFASLEKLQSLDDKTLIYCGHEYTLANLQFANHVDPDNSRIVENINQVQKLLTLKCPSLPSTLQNEKNLNPFLRCHEPKIKAAVETYCGKKCDDTVSVFAELRKWKNAWKK